MRQTTVTALLCLTVCCATAVAAATTASDEAAAAANANPLFPDAVAQQRLELLDRLGRLERNEEGLAERERLARFVDLSFEHALLTSPEFATAIGHPTGHDRWSDNSLAARERADADARQALAFLRSLDRNELSGVDRLNYDLLRQDFEETVEGQRFPGEYLAISQMGGIHQYLPPTLMRNPARTVADYEAILARLRAVPALVDNVIERLQKGLAAGVTPARVTLAGVPEQLAALQVDDPLTSPFLEPFTRIPQSVPAADRERLTGAAAATFREQIAPAFARLRTYVTDTYTPGAREATAMSALPDGAAWYAYRVKTMTTTDLTPEQIHQLGVSEVARIRAEMEAVMRQTGFTGSFPEFTHFLRTDPRFFYDDPEALLAGYRDIAKRIDPELVRLFGRLPRLPYGIKAVPAEHAKHQTTAYYEDGSLEAGQPGWFFANTYDLKSRPKWEMEALTVHEAVPGHHLQIALAQEQTELPWFRRYGGTTAFIEGWGLYSESLGGELGLYQDPYSKFGQLTYEIWRAIRLVVDTGMHQLGWSRQQAIDFFVANSSKSLHDIEVEIDRYIAWPGQALAYKIGELKIKELRAWAAGELGERFDIREFHDVVLGNGALPLAVLETQVREWVATQRAAS
jgi:uncharacterized protein (DUF885 family)